MVRLSGIHSGTIESLKWLALIAMLAEHWMRHVVGEVPGWVYQCARVAFPLFVIALALGLRTQSRARLRAVMLRMLAWAVLAQATLQCVDAPEGRLNVLFTFALGLGLVAAFEAERHPSPFVLALALAAAGTAALWCEFGVVGVAFVAAAVAIARADGPPAAAWLAVAGLLAALAVPNGNHFALAAVPVALIVWRLGIRLPRVRGAFYWAYMLQFPVFAGARMAFA
jgi:hypothetical protein